MKTKVFLTVVFTILISAFSAQAIPITIQIEALVDSVQDHGNYLEGQINPGDIITTPFYPQIIFPQTLKSVSILFQLEVVDAF